MNLSQLVAVFCTCCPWEALEPMHLGLMFSAVNRCPKCNQPTDALPVAGDREPVAGPDGTP